MPYGGLHTTQVRVPTLSGRVQRVGTHAAFESLRSVAMLSVLAPPATRSLPRFIFFLWALVTTPPRWPGLLYFWGLSL